MVTVVIAHRGSAQRSRENTVEAFRAAVELGADWIELDVRRTADDVLVVCHDAHLDDGAPVVEHRSDELPDWCPTLAAALDACNGAKVNIEIKNDPDDPDYDATHQISDAVVGLALAFREPDELLITSFDRDTVRRIQAVDAAVPVGLVVAEVPGVEMVVESAAAMGLSALHPWQAQVDRRLVDLAHAAGLIVNPWTVNEPDRILELIEAGVDGIITDDVATARAIIDEHRSL